MASPYVMYHLAFLKSSLERLMLWMSLFNDFLLYEGQYTFSLINTVGTTEIHVVVAHQLIGETTPSPSHASDGFAFLTSLDDAVSKGRKHYPLNLSSQHKFNFKLLFSKVSLFLLCL